MKILEQMTKFLNQALIWIAGVFLVAMVLLTCADIFLRLSWKPITGSVELVGFFSAIVTAFALGYTQKRRGHISVDVLIDLFPERVRKGLNMLNSAVCSGFFLVVAWRIAKWSTIVWKSGELTETLRIVFYPFSYGVAVGCTILALVFLTDLVRLFVGPKREGEQ